MSEEEKLTPEYLQKFMDGLSKGPLRLGIVERIHSKSLDRPKVLLPSGDVVFPLVSPFMKESLKSGDTVVMDGLTKAILYTTDVDLFKGDVANFISKIDSTRVKVEIHDSDERVYTVIGDLLEKVDTLKKGQKLLVCNQKYIAVDQLPSPGLDEKYHFLSRDCVPDVVLKRDLGAPHPFIEELMKHVHVELKKPNIHRKYGIRRSKTKLLCGVSGSGKTYSIQALWRLLYEEMAEHTGVRALSDLPQRVFRLRMPQILSQWLGQSDKNLDRFFDEIEALSTETFAPNGKEYDLPVLVICEEIDGLARSRGTDHDGVYDRIQTTALERLDVNCTKFQDRLILFLFTTNVPHLVDPAFLRRAGGTMEYFGRLSEDAFSAVAEKHIQGLPLSSEYGKHKKKALHTLIKKLTFWMYEDMPQVELSYGSQSETKHRKDFLTAALVDRAVQQAAADACYEEMELAEDPGISLSILQKSFSHQVSNIVGQLDERNVYNYLTIPEGTRVQRLRKLILIPHE